MEQSVLKAALSDRGDGGACNMPRIPTGRYPVYSRSLRATVLTGGSEAVLEFEAERDTLFTTMSATSDGDAFQLDAEYCNTKYLVRSVSTQWARCCDRKPIFLVGVRDNKTLTFRARFPVPVTADTVVTITLSGFQGDGCCD